MSPPGSTDRWTEVSAVWRVRARVHGADAADAVFGLLDGRADAVSAFETAAGEWRVEAYWQSPLLGPELRIQLTLAAAAAGGALCDVSEKKLAERDWLAENQLSFPPLRVGRFFIHGSHYRGAVPAGAVGILVDAAIAFGTGEHPSTRGCLLALQALARRRRFRKPLDIGTGTGILSIAAAKLLHRRVLAGDVDPRAAFVARHNAAHNGVALSVRVRKAPGYGDRLISKTRYDLILSNILARPLAVMAPDLARRLAPDGRAILSGLLRGQEPIVLAPHRACGLVLERRVVIDGWSTLVIRGGRPSDMKMGAEAPICEFGSAARPVRPPLGRRALHVPGRAPAGKMVPASDGPRLDRQFASGEARYRRANGRRAPSARRMPVAGAASRKDAARPTR